jgi:cobalt/nickel transport system permease protein
MIAIFIPFFREGSLVASYNLGLWRINITYEGLAIFINVIIKSWLCMLCLIVLSSSTRFTDMLMGMQKLKIPSIFIQIISFMYRYLFVLSDQVMRMKMARDSRNFGGKRKNIFKTIGNIIGILFIRSYERGERIYASMLSRGYDGQMPEMRKLRFVPSDGYFSIAIVILLVSPALLWW